MNQKKTIIIGIVTLLIIIIGVFIWQNAYNSKKANISNYEECVAVGYPIMDSYPEQCAVPGGKTFTRVLAQENQVTLEGKTICLLHKDTDGPHTLECAMGLQTDDGKYYSFKNDANSAALSVTDRRVRVKGTLTSDPDSIYQSEGTITVSSHEFLD